MNPKIADVVTMMGVVADAPDTPDAVKEWLGGLMNLLDEADTPDEKFVKGSPIVPGVGAQADLFVEVRDERYRLEKLAAKVKEREMEIYNGILSTLDESTDTGAAGEEYMVQRVEKARINVTDWPTLWKYISEEGAFDMLQKRVGDKAVEERFGDKLAQAQAALEDYLKQNPEADKDVARQQVQEAFNLPGILTVSVPTLSFTKRKK